MFLSSNSRDNNEVLNVLSGKDHCEYRTPKKLQSNHHRIISLRVKKSIPSPDKHVNAHQKTHSLMIGVQKLEIKIKQLEDSIEKNRKNSKISTRTHSIDLFAEEKNIEVSCSSDDSLNILREQVSYVKKLEKIPQSDSRTDLNLNFDETHCLKSSFSSTFSDSRKIRQKSFTEFAFLKAIPIINLN